MKKYLFPFIILSFLVFSFMGCVKQEVNSMTNKKDYSKNNAKIQKYIRVKKIFIEEKPYSIIKNKLDKLGIIDNTSGKILIKPYYNSISSFFNGYSKIEINGKFGLLDKNFEVVLKPIYSFIGQFIDNVAIVKEYDKYGCIDKNLNFKIKPIYDNIYLKQEKNLRIQLNTKWGYLDDNCNILVKPIYDYGYNFSNGIAKVIINNQERYINIKGKLLNQTKFKN